MAGNFSAITKIMVAFLYIASISYSPLSTAEEPKKEEEKPKDEKKEKKKKKDKDPKAEGEGEKKGEESGEIGEEFIITDSYVHKWIKFPTIKGQRVGSFTNFTYRPIKGKAVVVIFIASWCRTCQKLIGDFIDLEKKYTRLHTDFIYVFSHDTKKDATNFVDHFKMDGHNIMANHTVLRSFKEPDGKKTNLI